jgi:hypothetical protein
VWMGFWIWAITARPMSVVPPIKTLQTIKTLVAITIK